MLDHSCLEGSLSMNYRPRPGVVHTTICKTHVLIPTRAAYAYCPRLMKLPALWAATWDLLGQEHADQKIMRVHKLFTRAPDEKIRASVEAFCQAMAERGYLIREEDKA